MGYAYLPDGRRIDYDEYLLTEEWHQKRLNRLAYDCWQCGVCHRSIDERDAFHTHHLSYAHLGHEDIEHDLITMCIPCHTEFHQRWNKNNFFDRGDTDPIHHWKDYSLHDTARLCAMYEDQDYWFGGGYNLCSMDGAQAAIDAYFQDAEVTGTVVISENDIQLYIRNRRYDVIFESVGKREQMEAFLDNRFGAKNRKGGNGNRANARAFYKKHPLSAMKRIYKENENILILMDEAQKIKEELKHEQAQ